MKWLLIPVLALSITTTTLQAQQSPNLENLAIGVQCRADNPTNFLENTYGEIPMLQGRATVFGANKQQIDGDLLMFVNPETRSYTIQFSVEGQLFCMVVSGDELEAAPISDGI